MFKSNEEFFKKIEKKNKKEGRRKRIKKIANTWKSLS